MITFFLHSIFLYENTLNVYKFYFGSTLESCKTLSSSAPGAISDELPKHHSPSNEDSNNCSEQGCMQRLSKDSAMEDENCRSLSGFTDSSEQSAPVNFDMSNRVGEQFLKINIILTKRNVLFLNNCRQNFRAEFKI